ncbi:MAG TPA: flagellar hook-associated protein FlgL [Burkholderiaceae bacterium]|nr:flagellar hook-associated protein FlgL [Burkholderiaceae bacterium]
MRISSSLLFQTGLNSINAQQSDLLHLFQQIGSGRRMVTPADDPLGAAQAINIRQSQTLNARYAENRSVAQSNLGTEENTLNSVTLLMQDIKTRLVEAGNGTMSDSDRMTLANVLRHAHTNMLGLANATDGNGQYLFSGSRGDTAPFDENGNYLGDNRQRNIQVDQTRQLAGSDIGSDVFARATPGINTYVTAAGSQFGNQDANNGTGIISTASIYDGAQVQAGYRFAITIDNPATTYSIEVFDANGNAVTPANPADWINQPFEPGQDNLIKLPFGVQVKLSGNPEPGDVFSVAPAASEDMNIFKTLDTMIQLLETPFEANPAGQAQFQNVLASTIQRMDINYDNILTVRSSIGARMNELEALDANGSLRDLGYRSQISALEDLDYYTATTQLELRKSALEGATLAFRKIQGISLFALGSGR